jgi:hypothetical protein
MELLEGMAFAEELARVLLDGLVMHASNSKKRSSLDRNGPIVASS